MTTQPLTRIERAIVEILDFDPRHEILGQEMRSLLRRLGFRRSAPALVFTMMSLADKGFVNCREELRAVDGVTITDRYYRAAAN
jgi:hypothetical protein